MRPYSIVGPWFCRVLMHLVNHGDVKQKADTVFSIYRSSS